MGKTALQVSREWLDEHYTNQKLTIPQCAELLKCHINTVRRWLKRYGIKTRVSRVGELNPMFGRKGNAHHNYNSVEEKCPICGKIFQVPMYDIERRKTCSWKCRNILWKRDGIQAGENNPHWLGGIDYRRGENWNKVRDEVRARDGYKCTECGITEEKLGQQVDIHHRIPYRTFDNDLEANHPDNLVSMCKSCHAIADRAYCRAEKSGNMLNENIEGGR